MRLALGPAPGRASGLASGLALGLGARVGADRVCGGARWQDEEELPVGHVMLWGTEHAQD